MLHDLTESEYELSLTNLVEKDAGEGEVSFLLAEGREGPPGRLGRSRGRTVICGFDSHRGRLGRVRLGFESRARLAAKHAGSRARPREMQSLARGRRRRKFPRGGW